MSTNKPFVSEGLDGEDPFADAYRGSGCEEPFDYAYDCPDCEDEIDALTRLPMEHDPDETYYDDGDGSSVYWDEVGPETNWPDRD